MVLIIQIRYYYNEHATWVMCVFLSLSCNFIIVVCQPLGSKAFYFIYVFVYCWYNLYNEIVCLCVSIVIVPSSFSFFFIFIAFIPPEKPLLPEQRVP